MPWREEAVPLHLHLPENLQRHAVLQVRRERQDDGNDSLELLFLVIADQQVEADGVLAVLEVRHLAPPAHGAPVIQRGLHRHTRIGETIPQRVEVSAG